MLNFRKLKKDFSSTIVKEGKSLYDGDKVVSARLLHLDARTLKLEAVVQSTHNCFEVSVEIDREECETVDASCDCPYDHECQHLAALYFYLEAHLDELLVAFSSANKVQGFSDSNGGSSKEEAFLLETIQAAHSKEVVRQTEQCQKQELEEYITSARLLATAPFFNVDRKGSPDLAEFALIFAPLAPGDPEQKAGVEIQIALRLPYRSKPLQITNLREFLDRLRYGEPIFLAGKRYYFSLDSFPSKQRDLVLVIQDRARFVDATSPDKGARSAWIEWETFGALLAHAFERAVVHPQGPFGLTEGDFPVLHGFYEGNLDTPLRFFSGSAAVRFVLDYIPPPSSKILVVPDLLLNNTAVPLDELVFLECAKPGVFYKGVYYKFSEKITRLHLQYLIPIREMIIPEQLFGTFSENALPQLSHFAQVVNANVVEDFVTIPYVHPLKGVCEISYLNGELEAQIFFMYDEHKISANAKSLLYSDISAFITPSGILARNLVEERQILEDLFQDFCFDNDRDAYLIKAEKKIIEFMTDVIPKNQHRVEFHCPQNLLDQFTYDKTEFKLRLSPTDRIDQFSIELTVEGALEGIHLEQLWDCVTTKRAFIDLESLKEPYKKPEGARAARILVLTLEPLSRLVQIFDELGITVLSNHRIERPLWSLATIDSDQFKNLPVCFEMTDSLLAIRQQMIGEASLEASPIPSIIKATLRSYQVEGVRWLERLRSMYLNGILADDMGLGKTLQAICAITQEKEKHPNFKALIVCPTSLLYNWFEEFAKFNSSLRVLVVEGIPSQRKKSIERLDNYDVVVTSYTLLQKDIEHYTQLRFNYMILDEAQHIKNRGTRNAKSVKLVPAEHRVILSGTPIENSLDELWSLFDFLMPGFLGSYPRFLERYVRTSGAEHSANLDYLRKKVAPFILRRMKSDVLHDLPPITEIVYHCQLSPVQQALYSSYSQSARKELMMLVEREGFDRIHIHVLASLTRLKQICCHPAIFAKEKAEEGDSAKYDMLLELVQSLISGGHKTVIFSQYTRMLQIMREDFSIMGIPFGYLDGSSKNRMESVRQFNEDSSIKLFLVSLKAGGTGLNFTGANAVIHYDMWWNPAMHSQATDRAHRIGQLLPVSVYKLLTRNTIEEKIAAIQNRKKRLVKKIVTCDDEVISKLTWEEVLELFDN